MRRLLLIVAAACAACTSPNPVPPSQPSVQRPAADTRPFNERMYRLAVGDRIRVDVYGEPDLSLDAIIDGSGHINYPLLGRVPALGMTPVELEMSLLRKLTGDYLVSPNVRVTVLQFRPIYLVGQVQREGAYPFVEGLTVEKAIALAGGLTKLASERRIFIVRESKTRIEREPARFDTSIRPGDTIIVEESLF